MIYHDLPIERGDFPLHLRCSFLQAGAGCAAPLLQDPGQLEISCPVIAIQAMFAFFSWRKPWENSDECYPLVMTKIAME